MTFQFTFQVDDVYAHLAPLFQSPGRRTIIEIGAHDGRDSDLMRLLCRERPRYLAIEPDLRTVKVAQEAGQSQLQVAISDHDQGAEWWASSGITPGTEGRIHTDSSSLKKPTKHLEVHPWCEFELAGKVQTMTLDQAAAHLDGAIDLVWADVQGAQLEVIRGGPKTFARTRYLFIELHSEPYYEGEPGFRELHSELERVSGCDWDIVEQYPNDVLLERVVQ